jgi:hypothetical protein
MNTQPVSPPFTLFVQPQVPLAPSRTARPLRIGVVGTALPNEGAGQHIATHLAALGAEVTTLADPQPELFARERLDALAICSPLQLHREHLRAALAQGLHVLCEKPLLLDKGRDPVSDARPLVEGFAEAGKVLMLNEPWPYTLSFFDELYPEVQIFTRPPQHLAMLLCPAQTGFDMISNSVPHALSLLYALCPPGGMLERLRVHSNDARDGVPTALTISFQYAHSLGRTNVSIDLCQMAQSPRPAGYSIEGLWVRRSVEMPDYRLSFVASESPRVAARLEESSSHRPVRRLPITDPLQMLLADFLKRVQRAQAGVAADQTDPTLLERLSTLRAIYAVARTALAN